METMGAATPINPAASPTLPRLHAPAASLQGLAIFLERCEASGTLCLAMIWADLTTSFSSTTVKSCLPSQSCFRWNCACGRQVRASIVSSRRGRGYINVKAVVFRLISTGATAVTAGAPTFLPTEGRHRTLVFAVSRPPSCWSLLRSGLHRLILPFLPDADSRERSKPPPRSSERLSTFRRTRR